MIQCEVRILKITKQRIGSAKSFIAIRLRVGLSIINMEHLQNLNRAWERHSWQVQKSIYCPQGIEFEGSSQATFSILSDFPGTKFRKPLYAASASL